MNSMTESGVLPPLFSWIPAILARLQAQSIEEQVHPSNVVHSEVPEVAAPAAGGSKSKENHPAGVISIRHAGTRAGNGDNDEEMGGGQVVNTDACVLILTSFLQRSLQQLSSMTVPTASEQHSPSLMHSMIGGLRCLLSAPLILCIGGGKGVSALLEQPSVHMNTTGYEMGANGNVNRAAVPSSSSTATATVAEPSDVHLLQAGNRVIANWRSILSLWLELKEFAVQHYSGGDFDSSQAADSDIAWIDVVLSSCAPLVHTVPFVTYPVATHAGTVSVSVQEGLQEMYAVLWLVQAGVESSVQHRRKHAHSTLGSGLALTLLSLLVSTSVSLASMLCEGAAAIRAGAGGDSCVRNHYAAVNFSVLTKVIDAIISKYLTVFAQVHAHAMEMFGETPKYFICSTTFGASEIVFSNILKIIATVHRAATPVKGGGGGAGGGCGGSTMELIYVKRWTLSALSSMCAVNTAVNNSVRGFRTAVSRLAAGGSLRKVLREFASSLMLPGLGGGSSAVPDGEVQDIVLSAWRDLGGEEAELAGMFGTAQVPASSPITTAVSASASASGSASLANTSATVGQKRSFIPTVAPNPRVSAPTAVVEETPSKAARYEMPTTGFLKVSTPAAELAALAQKSRGGMHARQGFVPATYTGADRANLDQQSQQHSQLLSQMQSQQHSAQQPLDHSFQQQLPPAPPQVPSSGEAPQVPSQRDRAASQPAAGAPSQQSVWPDMSPPKRPTATSAVLVLQLQQQQQSHQGHVSQHSDSTTYVSPTPNAQQGPSHSQRRQHQHQHQQHYSSAPPSLPMPMDVCEEADADAVADVVAVGQSAQEQHGQSLGHPDNNRNADGNDDNTDKKPQDGTEEGESKKQETAAASGAASPAAVVAVQTEVLDVLQDIVSETCKPRNIDANYGRKKQHAGPTLMTTPPALGTVLQEAFLGINKAVEDLSVFASTASASAAPVAFSFVAASAGAGAAPTVLPVEVDSELLGAAIRQSHRLTGLLLDVLNQQQQLRASSGSASAEKDK